MCARVDSAESGRLPLRARQLRVQEERGATRRRDVRAAHLRSARLGRACQRRVESIGRPNRVVKGCPCPRGSQQRNERAGRVAVNGRVAVKREGVGVQPSDYHGRTGKQVAMRVHLRSER